MGCDVSGTKWRHSCYPVDLSYLEFPAPDVLFAVLPKEIK